MYTVEVYNGISIQEEFSDKGNGDDVGFYYWCDITPFSYRTLEEIKNVIDIKIKSKS